jgi:dihydroxyacetone kinase
VTIAYLRLNQDEVDKEHHKVVLDVLVAKVAAVAAHSQADVVSTRRVTRPGVLRP